MYIYIYILETSEPIQLYLARAAGYGIRRHCCALLAAGVPLVGRQGVVLGSAVAGAPAAATAAAPAAAAHLGPIRVEVVATNDLPAGAGGVHMLVVEAHLVVAHRVPEWGLCLKVASVQGGQPWIYVHIF